MERKKLRKQAPRFSVNALKSDRIKTALLLSATVVIVASVALAHLLGDGALDEHLCRTSSPPTAHTAILIDATTKLSASTVRRIRILVDEETKALVAHSRLSVFAITPGESDSVVTTLFSKCRPLRGNEVSPANDNPPYRDAVYREQFEAPLVATFDQVEALPDATSSPLLEALYEVARTRPTRLVIISDLLEHGDNLSFFRSRPELEHLRDSHHVADLDLSGVSVVVVKLSASRIAGAQKRAEPFWRELIRGAGAKDVRMSTIYEAFRG